jgi:hypothetical protein
MSHPVISVCIEPTSFLPPQRPSFSVALADALETARAALPPLLDPPGPSDLASTLATTLIKPGILMSVREH